MSKLPCSSLLAATCIAMLFQLGQAELQLPPPTRLIPGPPQPVNPGDISKCFSSVMQIQGCLMGLYTFVFTGQFGNIIGPACCNAFLAIDGNCMSKLLPSNALFPPLLKSYCAQSNSPSPGNSSPAPIPAGSGQ